MYIYIDIFKLRIGISAWGYLQYCNWRAVRIKYIDPIASSPGKDMVVA